MRYCLLLGCFLLAATRLSYGGSVFDNDPKQPPQKPQASKPVLPSVNSTGVGIDDPTQKTCKATTENAEKQAQAVIAAAQKTRDEKIKATNDAYRKTLDAAILSLQERRKAAIAAAIAEYDAVINKFQKKGELEKAAAVNVVKEEFIKTAMQENDRIAKKLTETNGGGGIAAAVDVFYNWKDEKQLNDWNCGPSGLPTVGVDGLETRGGMFVLNHPAGAASATVEFTFNGCGAFWVSWGDTRYRVHRLANFIGIGRVSPDMNQNKTTHCPLDGNKRHSLTITRSAKGLILTVDHTQISSDISTSGDAFSMHLDQAGLVIHSIRFGK